MPEPDVQLSPRERREYSLAAAILALGSKHVDRSSALAFDIDQQLRKDWPGHGHADERALLVPYGAFTRAGLDTKTSTKGAELNFQIPRAWLDFLRAQSVVMQAGATFITGLKGDTPFPFIASTETVSNVAQNPGSDLAESDVSFGSFLMKPREIQTTTMYSRQLLAQSENVPDNRIDRLIGKSIARQHAVQIDAGALGGLGTGNQPTGVATQLAGPQLIAFGTNGLQPTWALMVAIEAAVSNANAAYPEWDGAGGQDDTIPTSAFVVSPTMRERLRLQDRGGSTTTGRFILESDRMFSTYPVVVSNSVPQALTKGSVNNAQAIVFGEWEDLYIGLWGPGLELIVDPYTKKKQGMIEVTSFELFDVGVGRTGSFAGSLDALP